MFVPETTAVADSAHAAHGGENLFVTLLHHTQDSHELETPFGAIDLPHFAPFQLAGITFDMSITKHVVFLWLAALLLIILAIAIARRNVRRPVPHGFGNLIEMVHRVRPRRHRHPEHGHGRASGTCRTC